MGGYSASASALAAWAPCTGQPAEPAALKVIHSGLADDDDFRNRFRREVAISRLVAGPHVAKVIDFKVDSDSPWLATELVEGPTLAQAVARTGPLRGRALRDLAVGTASGLIGLHAAAVIHRDIKPANVILSDRGPVLVDFGVAAAAELTSMTGTGLRLGSAGWMSPEQVEGRPVTSATDVFSWGASIAFAAAGRNPYGTGPGEALAYRIAHNEPDLSDVPSDWVPVLAAALARRPQDRPSAEQLLGLASDPEAAFAAMPTAAHRAASPTAVEHSPTTMLPRKRPGRGPRIPPVAIAVILAVVFLAALATWLVAQRQDHPASSSTAETPGPTPRPTPGPAADTASAPPATSSPISSGDLTLLSRNVNAGDPRELAEISQFFADHVQEDVRINLDWAAVSGSLHGGTEGEFTAEAECFPTCKVNKDSKVGAIQGVSVYVDGLERSGDVTFAGLGSSWRMTGTFFVQSASFENGGYFGISLRVAGASPPSGQTQVADSCGVVEASPLPYPGRPLSVTGGDKYSPHVLLVQELLNVQHDFHSSWPCIAEDGYFAAETERAVREYQQLSGLEVDGVVGKQTYASLMLYFEGACPVDGC